MTDFHIKSNRKRFYADNFAGDGSGGGNLVSARFQVGTLGIPGTQEWGPDEHRYVIWDADSDWEEIGFPPDYAASMGGFFFPVAGEYHIDVNVHLWPPAPSPDRSGTAILAIETGGSGHAGNWHDTQSSTDESLYTGVNLVASTTRRFALGGQMSISVVMFGNDFIIPKVLLWASIEIVRFKTFSDGDTGGTGDH